ncbi:hypothetical protein LTR78_003115 [Recurvomyces mirabilis]|uniref:RBR-type E3 ubiquitin transferase n=1 Tax=Recurvomyces mirabilis TaxID=574656 RepID=A0AAE1C3T3_9PEZI|nr:hypothetical protein LTR78_003115 [Recurvomyces mirabilis]KAK5157063.1 hypothetical protein LTS14_004581 [Recurvomyces mirabilis]
MAPAAKRRKIEAVTKYLCFSCDAERTSKQFPDYNPSTDCDHLINTCKTCLKKWVQTQVDSSNYATGDEGGKVFGIRCPQCVAIMKDDDLEEVTTKKVYKEFEEAERKHIIDNTPGWRWCMAPDCRAGHVHESKTSSPNKPEEPEQPKRKGRGKQKPADRPAEKPIADDIFECKECGAKACVTCDRPWHEGESCEAYQARVKDRIDEEDLSLQKIKRLTKPCPGCKKAIEKDGGCSAMFCTRCSIGFCWNCLGKYDERGWCKCYGPKQ